MTKESSAPEQGTPKFSIPPARHQSQQPDEALLSSANCGLIVQRIGQLRGKYRSEGRQFARELAEYINENQAGLATVFLYEETFGTKERIHWFIHLRSLDAYPTMVAMGAGDEKFRKLILEERTPDGGRWDVMFLDGSLRETVLVPQRWRGDDGAEPPPDARARDQSELADDQLLHSANASSIVQISGVLKSRHRERGRRLARELATRWNRDRVGTGTAFLYEEAFGSCDRLHWLVHLSSLGAYRELAGALTPGPVPPPAADPAGGHEPEDWRHMFVDGSLREVALTPQYWGMYATQKK